MYLIVVLFFVAFIGIATYKIISDINKGLDEQIDRETEEEFKKNFEDVGVKKVYYPDNADAKKSKTYSTQDTDCKVKDVNLSDKRVSKTIVGESSEPITNSDNNEEDDDPIKNN